MQATVWQLIYPPCSWNLHAQPPAAPTDTVGNSKTLNGIEVQSLNRSQLEIQSHLLILSMLRHATLNVAVVYASGLE